MAKEKCSRCGSTKGFYTDYKEVGTNGLTITVSKCLKCNAEQPRPPLTPYQRGLLH